MRALAVVLSLSVATESALAVEPGLPSKTSIQAMIARAIGSHDPDPAVRNPDWLAERFVGRAERAAMAGTIWETALDLDWREAMQLPEFNRFVRVHLVRTRFIDEKLTEALSSGVSQVVIMGAGFDSRAYRFRSLFPRARFIELDYGPTQHYKKRRVEEIFGAIPANVAFAPIDFTKDKLGDALAKAGYRRRERTFFVWEGVPYSLPEPAVLETLRFIAGAPPGSVLVTDFVYQYLIDKSGKAPDLNDPPIVQSVLALTRRLKEAGEPWLSGIPEGKERQYLAAVGLRLTDLLPQGSAEATKRYRTRRDGSLVGSEPASFPSVGCFIAAVVPPR